MTTSAATLAELHDRFHSLVLPHLDRLLGFARRRVEVQGDAEDAVQEACVRAWLNFGALRDPANVRPWLYRILRAVLSDAQEKEGRRRQLVSMTRLEDAHDDLVAGGEDTVFAEVAARLSGEAVHRALAAIPDDFSTAVELHDIDGFQYHEIAEIVGVPIGTVMSRIYRGRKLLAGVLVAERAAWAASAPAADAGRRAQRGGG